MISIGPLLIFAVAVSIIVSYVMIIHKSLSGDAANNPLHDARVKSHGAPASSKSVTSEAADALEGRGTPKHA